MSWETRNGRGQFYTRSRRVAGRVVREYIGSGPVAELVATLDAAERTERAATRAVCAEERVSVERTQIASSAFDRAAKNLLHAAMGAAGYRQHARHSWRKRRVPKRDNEAFDTDDPLVMPGAGPQQEPPSAQELWAFLHNEPPPPAAPGAGPGRCAEAAWAALITGGDPAAREALDAQVRAFRAGFGGAESPVERVMIDQLVVAYLEDVYFGTRAAECLGDDSTDAHRDFVARGADRATRKLAFLMKQLFTVRRLLQPGACTRAPDPPRDKRRKGGSNKARPAKHSTAAPKVGAARPATKKRGKS